VVMVKMIVLVIDDDVGGDDGDCGGKVAALVRFKAIGWIPSS